MELQDFRELIAQELLKVSDVPGPEQSLYAKAYTYGSIGSPPAPGRPKTGEFARKR